MLIYVNITGRQTYQKYRNGNSKNVYVNDLWCNLNDLIYGVNNNFKNLRISYEKKLYYDKNILWYD
jgi:hypothetical protein